METSLAGPHAADGQNPLRTNEGWRLVECSQPSRLPARVTTVRWEEEFNWDFCTSVVQREE